MTTTGPVSLEQSSNWAGYNALGGPFTAVRGTFTVPALADNAVANEDTAEWVGIDGVENSSLIQAGVGEAVDPDNSQDYYLWAWWEVSPAASTPIMTMTLAPGDSVTVTISQLTGTTWEISIVDNTSGQSFTTQQPYTGPGQSAEWIVEAPAEGNPNQVYQLAPYAPAVEFSNLGTAGPVSSLQEDILVQGNEQVATPSAISAQGFSVANTSIQAQIRSEGQRHLAPTKQVRSLGPIYEG